MKRIAGVFVGAAWLLVGQSLMAIVHLSHADGKAQLEQFSGELAVGPSGVIDSSGALANSFFCLE